MLKFYFTLMSNIVKYILLIYVIGSVNAVNMSGVVL